MDCAACAHPNPEDARFCGACGAALASPGVCSGCGAAVAAGQRFCNARGVRLVGPDEDPSTPPSFDLSVYRPGHLAERTRAEGSALEGERKQVTVLFADVVDSMRLVGQVGAEEWRSMMERFL
jgi:hypothetical protein